MLPLSLTPTVMDLAYQKYECILAMSTLPEDETILNVL